jgi:Mor family transcriptional regulator
MKEVEKILQKKIRNINIPATVNRRDKIIMEAYNRGANINLLAQEFGLTRQRIYQIISKYKK